MTVTGAPHNPLGHPIQQTNTIDTDPRRLRILLSYAYLRTQAILCEAVDRLAQAGALELMVDSGAFTDYHKGRKAHATGVPHSPIQVADYADWLAERQEHIWQYVALDVVRDVAATRMNLNLMTARGLRPMPVFVYPQDMAEVPELVDINPHICVSGGVDADRKFMVQRFQRVYSASNGKARIHGLGFVKWPLMFQLPLHSVDSSSWLGGARYGSLHTFSPAKGLGSVGRRDLFSMKPRATQLRRALRDAGVTMQQMAEPNSYKGAHGMTVMAGAFASLALQQFAAARGLRVFLASTVTFPFVCALLAMRASMRADGGGFDAKAMRERWVAWEEQGVKERGLRWVEEASRALP